MNSYIQPRSSTAFQTPNIQDQNLDKSLGFPFRSKLKSREDRPSFIFKDKGRPTIVPFEEILYLKASHVYVEIICKRGRKILRRTSLTSLLMQLHSEDFIQTHRSFAVNVKNVSTWDNANIYMQETVIPISRSRKKAMQDFFRN